MHHVLRAASSASPPPRSDRRPTLTHSDPAKHEHVLQLIGPRTFINTHSHLPSNPPSTINPSIAKASSSTCPWIMCVLIYILPMCIVRAHCPYAFVGN